MSNHSVRQVIAATAPIGLAFIPLGMALGLLVVHAGLAWWWAPVFAAVIYAGSLEFLIVGLAAAAAPVGAVALTTFIVNSRHAFYALSFPLDRVKAVTGKLYSTYTLSDEAYAVAVSPAAERWTTRPILMMQAALQGLWVTGAALGGLIGLALPVERLRGLEFALTALFVVLAIDAYRQRPDRVTALAAVACAVASWLLVPGQLLVCAFAAFTVVLLARLAVEQRGDA
ncbi:AzlC family ABC transporter permease [Mycobacterium sp. OTB74]|jgi:4-azaleucine resistance transporter AzlC|uniref:AzlC family ABC transporter permease n=1 Tax=Mycobacterium sp. OTB74 TaxID=1853452 RepID=UPI002474308C|nr:AzlC family ABC transporter permease [Mycobacterium sp. OTB74]MDH6247054.1 4-azaleucine resistance transporter AzlC [Mycobacterium sp. OTB74]